MVMTLRTPRRRISPRTKRRYRAIREFFRRALGNPSQQEIQINSDIAVNVTDLKHKIVGIENQLSEVNKHCRDLVHLETNIRSQANDSLARSDDKDGGAVKASTVRSSERKSKSADTKILYKTSDNRYRRSDESDYVDFQDHNDGGQITPPRNMNSGTHKTLSAKTKTKEDRYLHEPHPLRNHKTQSNLETLSSEYSTSSYHSLAPTRKIRREPEYSRHKRRKSLKQEIDTSFYDEAPKKYNKCKRKSESPAKYEEKHTGTRKTKQDTSQLDQDFIADIIRRQYKPMKLFGRRQSDMSQFSAPMCRDQEFSLHEDIQEGSELCSCCYESHNRSRYVCNNDLSDMRSICDTRLYSTKKPRNRHHKRYVDIYNDSTMYDLIPVKEKSSPKARRKFVEDNVIPYSYYKEVPPSPRTLRPRLNLKAQYYTEYDDYMVHVKHPNRRQLPVKPAKYQEYCDTVESDVTSEIIQSNTRGEKTKLQKRKVNNVTQVQQDMGTMSSLQYPHFPNEQVNTTGQDITLNKTHETDLSIDKTDRALCEIKDILQSFLQEIKKDTSPSQSLKSDIIENPAQKQQHNVNAGVIPHSTHSNVNNYSGGHCINPSFVPPFTNPCCYPIMPVCPINCVQNGYLMPNPSFSCHACANAHKETTCHECPKPKTDVANETLDNTIKSHETEELIKEIYKFVAQNPNALRKKGQKDKNSPRKESEPNEKVLTSRSVGGSTTRASRHDAQVGTPTMKCYSKSCEAIGSKMDHNHTYTTHSDTILEKLSLEATLQSMSDSDLSTESTVAKKKKSKFAKVLQSLGLFKKKNKESTDELTDSESSVEVDVKPRAPYKQHVTNYMMHGQEYFHPPPVPPYNRPERPLPPFGYPPPPGYDPRIPFPYTLPTPLNDLYTPHRVHQETIHEHTPSHYRTGRLPPSAPPQYDPHCSHSPQVPLCLKEIEVKSTGTQSEKKMSFFRKFSANPPPRATVRREPPKTNGTQTQTIQKPGFFSNQKKQGFFSNQKQGYSSNNDEKPGLFSGWKNLQSKIQEDPMHFSYNTQKKLAEGDVKMRNAVLKKLFYKRNPFSPRNLIVRTILGKDKSSFGEPQMVFRPRMFF